MPRRLRIKKAREVFAILRERYPDADCALEHANAWQLLAATILSAQCTDKRVNMVTPALFARYPTPDALAGADPAEVESIIQSTGFFREKTKSLIAMSGDIADRFGGEVPRTMAELTTLRGVARKTANVILGTAFGLNEGVVVDTHIRRISNRLGWTKQQDPVKIERDLMALFPKHEWSMLGHTLILHGRDLCEARKPRCAECPVSALCPSASEVP